MRSGLIFAASSRIPNRYMLCRTLAASARKMHRDGASTADSINRCLQALHDAPEEGSAPAAADATADGPADLQEKGK
jgi:hypothetical protein